MPNELGDFFTFIIFLFYGLVFFTTGVAIASKVTRGSKLKIARYLPLFAIFAFVHAIHEWLVLFLFLEWPALPQEILPIISRLRLVPVSISYVFLLLFGYFVLQAVYPQRHRILRIITISLPVILFLSLLYGFYGGLEAGESPYRFAAMRIRNLLGFPGALAAGLGLIGYAGTIRGTSVKVARNFTGAGIALIVYGIFAGLVPTGAILPLGVRVELIRGVTGMFILHFLMNALHIFDLEREEMIEERLQRFAQTEKLTSLGKLAAGIAHEINNPLANVSLNVEMLKKSFFTTTDGEKHEKRFVAIERNLDRASRIARELLAFSRQEENAEAAVPLDLNEVLRDTLTLLGPRRHDYVFELALNPLPSVQGLPWKIEEVFLNILINAMEATASGGKIALSTRAEKNTAVVEITDSGIGIAAENIHSIFDPFFTTKEVGKGTGLGLSICFGIMEWHGGRIEASSKPGLGTTMTLTFPAEGKSHIGAEAS
jgi:two-component system, NtrC family, sensor kinase